MHEIVHNLWLGDRRDAELLAQMTHVAYWTNWQIIAIADYPSNEIPNEPKSAEILSIFTREASPEEGTEWYDSHDLRVDTKVLDYIADNIERYIERDHSVLVHCVAGIHRSPLVVAWFLWRRCYFDTLDEAYDYIKSIRPEVERREYWLTSQNPPEQWWQK